MEYLPLPVPPFFTRPLKNRCALSYRQPTTDRPTDRPHTNRAKSPEVTIQWIHPTPTSVRKSEWAEHASVEHCRDLAHLASRHHHSLAIPFSFFTCYYILLFTHLLPLALSAGLIPILPLLSLFHLFVSRPRNRGALLLLK